MCCFSTLEFSFRCELVDVTLLALRELLAHCALSALHALLALLALRALRALPALLALLAPLALPTCPACLPLCVARSPSPRCD